MYKYINEPKTESEQGVMWKTVAILRNFMSLEDSEKLEKEFILYRDGHYANNEGFEPWYVWFMKQIDVNVTMKIKK